MENFGTQFRFVSDLKSLASSKVFADVGQSGNWFSSHYDDLLEGNERGEYESYKEHPKGEFLFINEQ